MRAIERKGEEERRPEVDARVQSDWRAVVNLKELMPWRTVNLIGNMAYFDPVSCHFDFRKQNMVRNDSVCFDPVS